MLILISNDDGIHAPGLKALVRTMRDWANIVVVAPEREQSASSHSLTLHRPLRIRTVSKNRYAVDGTPTDCVMLAVHQILDKRPDLIISGINRGANLGDDVHYSGTVSAAMEGAILNIPSVAISLAVFGGRRCSYSAASEFTLTFCKKLMKRKLPSHVLFNINVPNVPAKQLKGTEVTKLGKRNYGDVIVEKTDPRGRQYYWIGGDQAAFYERPGTDCMAILNHSISVTPLQPDLTHRPLLKEMRSWSAI